MWIAFPSLAVPENNIPLDVSFAALFNSIYAFLSQSTDSDAQLLLVEPKSLLYSSPIFTYPYLTELHSLEQQWPSRFRAIQGDITALSSQENIPSVFAIVNPSNHRFSNKGGLTNEAVYTKAGPELISSSKNLFPTKLTGIAYPLPLSNTNPLFLQEGYSYVILVKPPNLNPVQPECETDVNIASNLLEQSYFSVFAEGNSLVRAQRQGHSRMGSSQPLHGDIASLSQSQSQSLLPPRPPSTTHGDIRSDIDGCFKTGRPIVEGLSAIPIYGGDDDGAGTGMNSNIICDNSNNNDNHNEDHFHTITVYDSSRRPPPSASSTFNKRVLYSYLRPPPLPPHLQQAVFYQDDICIVVYDAYPKAKVHLLLMLKYDLQPVAENVRELVPSHLSRLQASHRVARRIASSTAVHSAGGGHRVLLGYHAIPSLLPLHLHIISNDMDSVCMKTKSHWNSFTTDFLIPIDFVEQTLTSSLTASLSEERLIPPQLQQQQERTDTSCSPSSSSSFCRLGSLMPNVDYYEDRLKFRLRCHGCGQSLSNMPSLKTHVARCTHIE
eukprot:gene7600-15573_t